MPLLCFGGSFNPIHHGHLICSRWVAEAGGYDRVALIPSSQPPHKPNDTDLASPADRAAMCRLAIRGTPGFDVNDLELHRTGPSYTLDTVRELRRQGVQEVNWLLGADMVRTLPKWHQVQSLLAEVHFVLIARPGWSFDWNTLPSEFQSLQRNIVVAPQIDLSASLIRQRLAIGRPIDWLTPPAVVDYIRQQNLYRPPSSPAPSP